MSDKQMNRQRGKRLRRPFCLARVKQIGEYMGLGRGSVSRPSMGREIGTGREDALAVGRH